MDLEETSTPSDFLNQEPSKQEKNEVSSVKEPGVGEFSATRVAVWDSSMVRKMNSIVSHFASSSSSFVCPAVLHLVTCHTLPSWHHGISTYHTIIL